MKLEFQSNWAHPIHGTAYAGQVRDVDDEAVVKELIDGKHAKPHVPKAVAEGAKPDVATEARIAGLESTIAELVKFLKDAGAPVPETVVVPNPDAAFTTGPFAQV